MNYKVAKMYRDELVRRIDAVLKTPEQYTRQEQQELRLKRTKLRGLTPAQLIAAFEAVERKEPDLYKRIMRVE